MYAGNPPEGATFTKQGVAEAIRVAALKTPKAPTAQATDSIAPTEFPKRRSATSRDRYCYRTTSATYASQEEKIHASSRK
jgi:hypothetical protein